MGRFSGAKNLQEFQMAQTNPKWGVQIVGTDAVPVVFSATAGTTDVLVFTHNYGFTAEQVQLLTVTSHQIQPTVTLAGLIGTTGFTVVQTTNIMTITNLSAGPLSVLIWINWQTYSPVLGAPIAGMSVTGVQADTRFSFS
jgi:hypothetical protein